MTMQREWFEKDYYAALGVPSSSPQKEITTAYRRLARQFHPDANPGDDAAEERFKEVSAAYDVVGDPDRRAAGSEDRFGRLARSGVDTRQGIQRRDARADQCGTIRHRADQRHARAQPARKVLQPDAGGH